MTVATWRRVLQFRAGPNDYEFHACDRHKANLESGDVSNFFADPKDKIAPVDPANEYRCYWCDGEDGPDYDKETT